MKVRVPTLKFSLKTKFIVVLTNRSQVIAHYAKQSFFLSLVKFEKFSKHLCSTLNTCLAKTLSLFEKVFFKTHYLWRLHRCVGGGENPY